MVTTGEYSAKNRNELLLETLLTAALHVVDGLTDRIGDRMIIDEDCDYRCG